MFDPSQHGGRLPDRWALSPNYQAFINGDEAPGKVGPVYTGHLPQHDAQSWVTRAKAEPKPRKSYKTLPADRYTLVRGPVPKYPWMTSQINDGFYVLHENYSEEQRRAMNTISSYARQCRDKGRQFTVAQMDGAISVTRIG